MSTLTNLISGGGGGAPAEAIQREFTFDVRESETVSLPFSGTVDVYAIGAGGGAHSMSSASFNTNNTGNTRGLPLNGGGGGGCAVREGMEVAKGDELVITIGAGGQLVNSNNNEANNGAGGDTTVNTNSNNITISLTGGGGGCGGAGVNKKNGNGGTASGGDSNYTGGRGGHHTGNKTTNPNNSGARAVACGGGSAAYQADGHAGGDLDYNWTTAANYQAIRHATGGGGIGGSAASVTITGNIANDSQIYATGAAGGSMVAGTATKNGNSNTAWRRAPAGPKGFEGRNGNNLSDLAHPVGRTSGGRNFDLTYTQNTATSITGFTSGPGAGQEPVFIYVASNANNSNVTVNATGPGIFGGKGAVLYDGVQQYHTALSHEEAPNVAGGGAGAVSNINAFYEVTDLNTESAYYGGQGLVRIVYNSFS